ncbi:hypothetical protein GGQ07_001612 [Salinibacter ruber]|uniref:BREX-1 system adenine-specific DNA-methyltransferase PglX n=1 Tax=Salinibacter ruber TaxID=146919 RepID=UPI002169AC80|nr:BREX-1 system adenine-specific DNA-methyltransferase PglX [Salinibacter ruber]MCS4180172.1 hypothetical protein [Salinibacter ruber]
MDTSGLESFAQTLRTELLNGVRQRLRYWGFQDDGSVEEKPEEVEGGYIFRGEVHNDPGVPKKWRALKNAVNRHDVDHVAEEAAYTWFNRLVAIRILEKNGYITRTLGYAEETTQPAVLYRAKQNEVFDVVDDQGEQDVREAILESDDDRAFRQLLIGVCHDNDLLNDVFGRLNDFTELLLPTGLLQPDGVIDELVTTGAISDEDYEQVELIGWLYQFYISEKKDEVYDSSGKFQPEDIPAATQIFTPHWIVRYMVENTIGKQWLEKYPDSPLRDEMEYLVENDNEDTEVQEYGGAGEQMAVFDKEDDGDPTEPIFDDLSELELFDPAAGSGHILVVGFDLLMEMYRERGYTDREAVEQILTENLKGLEIDLRAAQLARFALLMKAAQYDRRALDRDDQRPEVYAMPEPRDFSTSDLRAYLGDEVFDAHGVEIKEALDLMAEHGQNVGSALKMNLSDKAHEALARRIADWDKKTKNGTAQLDAQALHQELRDYIKTVLMLTRDYPAVATNPPYMGSRNMNGSLKSYTKEHYPDSKRDLFAVFMKVGEEHVQQRGRLGMINQQSWMFLKSYSELRTHFLKTTTLDSTLHLGLHIFEELNTKKVQSTAFVLLFDDAKKGKGIYYRLINSGKGSDKRNLFLSENAERHASIQKNFLPIPNSPIAYWIKEEELERYSKSELLSDFSTSKKGIDTGNNDKFLRKWWEVSLSDTEILIKEESRGSNKWFPYNKGGDFRKWYGNRGWVLNWNNNGYELKQRLDRSNAKPTLRNLEYMFESGFTWSTVCLDFSCRYTPPGALFDNGGSTIFADNHLYKIGGLLNSKVADRYLDFLSPTLNYQPGDIENLPIEPELFKSNEVGTLVQDAVECARSDYDSREISWDFAEHPLVHQNSVSLEKAYDAWVLQATDSFFRLHANEERINELLIDLYGLEDELSPRVALDDITILEDELDRDALEELDDERDNLSDDELRQRFLEDDPDDALFQVEVPIRQFLSYGVGVMLGRYRLGHDGLHIAHPNPSSDELAPYEVPVPLSGPESNGTEHFEIDDDAIVPLMGRDSPFSDDAVIRMRDIVRLIWGEETLTENLNFINHALSVGRSRGLKRDYEKTLEEWLVGDFWDWHKDLYKVPYYGIRPIYLLFQSPEGHFQVLVYMHRMDKYTPQRVRQDYLQRYQEWLRREIESLESQGEETLSTDQSKRLDTLREAATDCRDYDAILKDVADQQIEIDLDDGVQNNYPKFGDAVADL